MRQSSAVTVTPRPTSRLAGTTSALSNGANVPCWGTLRPHCGSFWGCRRRSRLHAEEVCKEHRPVPFCRGDSVPRVSSCSLPGPGGMWHSRGRVEPQPGSWLVSSRLLLLHLALTASTELMQWCHAAMVKDWGLFGFLPPNTEVFGTCFCHGAPGAPQTCSGCQVRVP